MDIGSLLLIISISILVILFVFRPFLANLSTGNEIDPGVESEIQNLDHQYSALMAEKERLLRALSDLESDQSMGKIPEEDYPVQRAHFLTEGARVLQNLDSIEEKLTQISSTIPNSTQFDLPLSEYEAQVKPGEADPIEEMVASRRRLREEKSAGFCPRCGKVIQKSDVYCPRCGVKVIP
jgi:hypothetical protein